MAWSDEVIALAPRLRAYVWAMTRGAAEVDDLVQEALMRAWQFRHTFQPDSNLKAWLFRIQRNVVLASVSGRPKPLQDGDGVFSRFLAHQAEQEWRVQANEMLRSLRNVPRQNSEALLLVAGGGLTYEEAAEALGCSVGTIKSRVSRARDQLAALMAERDAAPEPPVRTAPPPPKALRPPPAGLFATR